MQPEIGASALAESAARVLEDAAFLFTEPVDQAPPPDGEMVSARIRFQGPCSGFLQINTPVEGCTLIAANMLGVDPDDDDAVARGKDALGEILNILCGSVLGEAFAGGQEVTMGLPYVTSSEDARLSEHPTTDSRACLVTEEGFGVEFVLRLEPRSPGEKDAGHP